MLGQNLVITKDVKSFTYYCYVRCVTLIVRVGGIPCPPTLATHYHTQLGLQDKGRAIKGLIVFHFKTSLWILSLGRTFKLSGINFLRVATLFTANLYAKFEMCETILTYLNQQ